MELLEPRPKRYCKLAVNSPFPIVLNRDNSIRKIKGVFNDFSVIVEDINDMKNLVSMGYFGKANFSRSYPQFIGENNAEIIRRRQYDRRGDWSEANSSKDVKKVIVVPDSDEETDYFTNLRPEYKLDRSGIKETVWLSPEESFFLNNHVKCLDIYYKDKALTSEEAWTLFSQTSSHFQYNYIAYHYFRAKNWVVKPGIKFGGEFLLYKQGPPFYHASYVVIIDILSHDLKRLDSLSRRSMDNVSLLGLNRLCETAGKELLILQIILPESANQIDYKALTQYSVQEVLMRRWILTQENT